MVPGFFGQDMIRDYFSQQPSQVIDRGTTAEEMHRRYLYNKIFSVYDITLPEGWHHNWFRFFLFYAGSIGVIYTKKFGWIASPYSVTKIDREYNPAVIQVYNHSLPRPVSGIIGVNAGLVTLMDDYRGLDDLVRGYASILANIDRSINVNLMNSNVTMMARAKNNKEAGEIKEAYEQATSGKPYVVIGNDVLNGQELEYLLPNVKGNFVVPELIAARRNILNMFLTDVGIRNFNQQKGAQQSETEITENNGETSALCWVIYNNIKRDFERINEISGLGLQIRQHYNYGEGVANGENNTMGDV